MYISIHNDYLIFKFKNTVVTKADTSAKIMIKMFYTHYINYNIHT